MAKVDHFVEAVATGKVRYRRLMGLRHIRHQWPQAMQRVVELGSAHPDAQRIFLDTWVKIPTYMIRQWVGDDDLFFAALRILLPSYNGPSIWLFRGQGAGDPTGLSWSRSYQIAVKFALYGGANVDPNNLQRARKPIDENGIVLSAHVDSSAIICAPCLLGHKEGEYILDPRGLVYSTACLGPIYTYPKVARVPHLNRDWP
jgi:hypothetical protein